MDAKIKDLVVLTLTDRLLDNLMQWGFQGDLQLVHPYVQEIAGIRTLDSVSSLKAPVDLAVISTPRDTTPGIVWWPMKGAC